MSESLDHKLTTLKLGRMRQVYTSWIEQAAQTEMGYGEFLEQLVTEEVLARQENQVRRRMHAAGFPYAATIDQFDFTLRPELKRTVMLRFFDSSFMATASSLVLIGASGLGKTHLAVALGTKMVQLGYMVRFVMAQHIANAVLTATTRSEITRLMQQNRYTREQALIAANASLSAQNATLQAQAAAQAAAQQSAAQMPPAAQPPVPVSPSGPVTDLTPQQDAADGGADAAPAEAPAHPHNMKLVLFVGLAVAAGVGGYVLSKKRKGASK